MKREQEQHRVSWAWCKSGVNQLLVLPAGLEGSEVSAVSAEFTAVISPAEHSVGGSFGGC